MFENPIGKSIIVGITILDDDNELIEQFQIYGKIKDVDPHLGVIIDKADGSGTFTIAPYLQNIFPAKPGIYRLRSTGEEVIDPDCFSNWTINAGPEQTYEEIRERIEYYRQNGFGPFNY